MCVNGLDLLMYLANGSGEADVRKPAPLGLKADHSPSILSLHLFGLLPFASFNTSTGPSSLTSPVMGSPQHLCVLDPQATLAKYERGDHSAGPVFPCLDQ